MAVPDEVRIPIDLALRLRPMLGAASALCAEPLHERFEEDRRAYIALMKTQGVLSMRDARVAARQKAREDA